MYITKFQSLSLPASLFGGLPNSRFTANHLGRLAGAASATFDLPWVGIIIVDSDTTHEASQPQYIIYEFLKTKKSTPKPHELEIFNLTGGGGTNCNGHQHGYCGVGNL